MKQQKRLFENVKRVEKMNKMTRLLKTRGGKTQVTNIRNKVFVTQLCLTLCNPWTVACQAPLSMGFSRQQYWSGWPFPSPGGLPDSGIKPRSPAPQADSLLSESPGNLKK